MKTIGSLPEHTPESLRPSCFPYHWIVMHSARYGNLSNLLTRADDIFAPGQLPPISTPTSSYGTPACSFEEKKKQGFLSLEIQGRVVEWMDMAQYRHFLDPWYKIFSRYDNIELRLWRLLVEDLFSGNIMGGRNRQALMAENRLHFLSKPSIPWAASSPLGWMTDIVSCCSTSHWTCLIHWHQGFLSALQT